MTMSEAPGAISLLLPEHWFGLPLSPAPNPTDLQIADWDQSTISKFTNLLTMLGETGKAANITTAAAAIYEVGEEVTVTSVAAGYQRFPELETCKDNDLTEIFPNSGATGHAATARGAANQGDATEEVMLNTVDLPAGSAVRRQRSISISDERPSTIIIDFVIRPTSAPDTAVTLSFSAFGARPDAFIGLFDGLATGLQVMGR